ncbi:hypothetical protein BDK51DRAFT_48050 [Blyttiomyces helicus]|uniref:Uncharacterized protein n=1 Tax=Blyttiomyces helicus TaxID=388810 RepID=A0A4P9W9W0_9FUNG|nr:hypothetical protein BDK51DRAFT_48050 [Blyttiomyces helicus]|eukprot:RKO88273.1 hypothetical protein BDK51DRAFT_48050 [Blyttiomyces helicus]
MRGVGHRASEWTAPSLDSTSRTPPRAPPTPPLLSIPIIPANYTPPSPGGRAYAKSASGNVATEEVLNLLHGLGMHTGVNLTELSRVRHFISDRLGRGNASEFGVALPAEKK